MTTPEGKQTETPAFDGPPDLDLRIVAGSEKNAALSSVIIFVLFVLFVVADE
jgi:hypothetical protein